MSVGSALPHDAAVLHVTGAARYVDDVPVPAGCLHLAFGLSAEAAGRITSVDLTAVRASEGVVAVLQASELPFANDVSASAHDEPLLADGTVHYVGQPIFLVVATSHRAARVAARKGKVQIERAEPILTVAQAEAANERFEDGPRIYGRGDVEAALAAAPHRTSGRLEIGGQEHFYLEGQAALALPGEGGDMHVISSTQHPTEIQHKVADALGVPMHGVRVETRRMGGGFGGKESQANTLAIACAVAARQTGHPCKMRYDRDDDMVVTGKRHVFEVSYEVGFDSGGVICALDVRHDALCGWAQDLSLPVADRAMLHADNAYWLEAVRITSHRWRTNHQSATAFRGFGGPQGMLGMERIVDHVAHILGRDPLAVRRTNFYRERDCLEDNSGGATQSPLPPGSTKHPATPRHIRGHRNGLITPYGQVVEDFIGDQIVDALVASSDYQARREAVVAWNAANNLLKRGLALTPVKFGISFTLTHLNQAGALVHVYSDGSIHLNHGGTEMGQGLFQKVAQVAASRFGVGLEAIKITATDTGKVPNTSATAASSGSDLNGMAVKAACDVIRERMAAHLAQLHHCEPKEVVFGRDKVRLPGREYTFGEAAGRCYEGRVPLSATGFYKTPEISWDRITGQGRPFFYFAYGVAAVEVAVDTLTGENRMLRADILHDAGASLNPALDIGQVEGGFVQGAGWLTTEELVWDDAGRLRTHAPSTYKIPACGDRPDVFNVALWDGENRADTIYKSKAVGEPPLMLGIATFLALSDACAACGPHYPDLQAPATAEAVLAAVQRARG